MDMASFGPPGAARTAACAVSAHNHSRANRNSPQPNKRPLRMEIDAPSIPFASRRYLKPRKKFHCNPDSSAPANVLVRILSIQAITAERWTRALKIATKTKLQTAKAVAICEFSPSHAEVETQLDARQP
jgi:hypothetical protein